jgi:hypothetical protein
MRRFFHQESILIVFGYDLDRQIGNKALYATLAIN